MLKQKVKQFLTMQLGIIILCIGVYFFKTPNRFATGGVSGLSIILVKLFPVLTQAQYLLYINTLLLVLGVLILGKGCGINTIICSMEYSIINRLLERFIPMEKPFTNQPLMELVYAILLSAIASAILFNCDASSGGTDIIALILKKYTKKNVGTALLYTDAAIAFSNFFVNGIEAGLYSVLGLFMKAFLVDGVIESINLGKYFTIITTKPDEISQYAINVLGRGVTRYKAVGVYTGEEKTVLLIICHRSDAIRLRAKAKEIDPQCFMVLTNSSEIIGRGFLSE